MMWGMVMVELISRIFHHIDERNREKASFGGITEQTTFHPIFVLGVFINDYDNITFFERQFVFIICFAIIKRSTFATNHKILQKENIGVDFTIFRQIDCVFISKFFFFRFQKY